MRRRRRHNAPRSAVELYARVEADAATLDVCFVACAADAPDVLALHGTDPSTLHYLRQN